MLERESRGLGAEGLGEPRVSARMVLLALVGVWVLVRVVFWLGYAHGDDLVYAHYAWTLDHFPVDHREFRLLPVLAIAALQRALGPTELAAAVPSLAGSLMMLVAVAWSLGWPARREWWRTGAMVLAATVPVEVVMASYPGAGPVAAGFGALGAALFTRDGRRARVGGTVLLGLAVTSHELLVFWVVALAVGTLVTRRDGRWGRLGLLGLAVVVPVAVEAAAYWVATGEPLARWTSAATEVQTVPEHRRIPDLREFFTWPVRIVFISKQFGLDLLGLAVFGVVGWRRLESWQRTLLVAAFAYWAWLGYGTQVPWDYVPRSRAFHYYLILAFPVGAVLGASAVRAVGRRLGLAVIAVLVLVHGAGLAVGGSWGQSVEVSRDLLRYTRAHPDLTFLADVHTLNEMTALHGFRRPSNVVCAAVVDSERVLLANRARSDRPVARAPEVRVDAVLRNRQLAERRPDRGFREIVQRARLGEVLWRREPQLKAVFVPVAHIFARHPRMVRNLGGEIRELPDRPWNIPDGPAE